MARLQPIDLDTYQPLREAVCETLRDAIRKGILEPGERLMEVQLADELGISRTPVREAIRKLEQEGYVIMMPRRGTYVSDVSVHDVKEIFEIRSALESLATGLAARKIEPEELEKLQNLLVEIEGYISKNDIEKIVESDIKFHGLIYQVSGNERLVNIINNLKEQTARFRTLSMSYPGRLQETLEEHSEMVEAIANGDVSAARDAAERHMESAEKTLLKAMRKAKNS
jgi:DNA-binding GntR family transcriptional regulator